LDLAGFGFTYDGSEQLTGGTVTSIAYQSDLGDLNLSVNVSAASFATWVATDATVQAFATILSGDDSVAGSPFGGSLIRGYDGNDTLYAGGGADSLFGGAGDDHIYATFPPGIAGFGGPSPSYLRGEDGNDIIVGGLGFDDINGNKGNDTIDGGPSGNDWLVGGQGDDLITAHTGQNILYGNLGDDTLNAGSGGELMRGGQGNDSLVGGAGNDWLSGDRGNDTLTGGAGADTFHTASGAGVDRVLDFHIAEGDRVQVDAGTTYAVNQVGADTVIDMGNGDQMILVGVQTSTLTGGWIFTV